MSVLFITWLQSSVLTKLKIISVVLYFWCIRNDQLAETFLFVSSRLPVNMKQLNNQRHDFHEICQ